MPEEEQEEAGYRSEAARRLLANGFGRMNFDVDVEPPQEQDPSEVEYDTSKRTGKRRR